MLDKTRATSGIIIGHTTVKRATCFQMSTEGEQGQRDLGEGVIDYLFGCFSGLPLAVRMLSTSAFASLFEHLKTTTGEESLPVVLLA